MENPERNENTRPPDLHTGFSRGRSGGLVFSFLSGFSTVYCDPHSKRRIFRFGKFSSMISSNIVFIPFSLSSPSKITIMCHLRCVIISTMSCILLSFVFNLLFCLLSWLVDFHYSIFQITYSSRSIFLNVMFCWFWWSSGCWQFDLWLLSLF